MFSLWHVLCIAPFLEDHEKLCVAETSHKLLRLFRAHCALDVTLFGLSAKRSKRFLQSGWNLAELTGSLWKARRFSETQRAAVTTFFSHNEVSEPQFAQFPNLKRISGVHTTPMATLDLVSLHRLETLSIICGEQPNLPRLKLPTSLTCLRVVGATPQAESCTLERLMISAVDASQSDFNFPALRCASFHNVSNVERCFPLLPENLQNLQIDSTSRTDFRSVLRFRSLRVLILETELCDESFAVLMAQLPETLENINLINTCADWRSVTFSALGRMQNLQTLRLELCGGIFDMNFLRNCKRLESVRLLRMGAVVNVPPDPQAIWPRLTQSNLEVRLF